VAYPGDPAAKTSCSLRLDRPDKPLIVRNSASGNTTNYVIDDGNKVGTIVSAPSSTAISGDTGGAGVGTTNPWASFTF